MGVVVPYQATGWRYLQVGRTDATDYSSPSFDDTTWATGQAPFGSVRGPLYANLWDPFGGFNTHWDIDTRIWLRRALGPVQGPVELRFRIDNFLSAWWNGNLVVNEDASTTVTTERSYAIPDGFLGGNNVLALRATDDAFEAEDTAFIDAQVLDGLGGWVVGSVAIG